MSLSCGSSLGRLYLYPLGDCHLRVLSVMHPWLWLVCSSHLSSARTACLLVLPGFYTGVDSCVLGESNQLTPTCLSEPSQQSVDQQKGPVGSLLSFLQCRLLSLLYSLNCLPGNDSLPPPFRMFFSNPFPGFLLLHTPQTKAHALHLEVAYLVKFKNQEFTFTQFISLKLKNGVLVWLVYGEGSLHFFPCSYLRGGKAQTYLYCFLH